MAFGRCRSALAFGALVLCGACIAQASGRLCTSSDVFNFGNRAVGSSTAAHATVTNCGDAPWSFTDVSVHPATGPAFAVTTSCVSGAVLAPGAQCTVGVVFAPTIVGQTSGGLWLHNSTTTPDQIITFYGRGVDARTGTATLAFEPAAVVFPAQAIGTQSDGATLLLHNAGPAAITLSALVLNGPDPYDFIGDNETCQVGSAIAPGAFCHMSLYFRPSTAGTRRANLVIDAPELAALAVLGIEGVGAASTPATVDVVEYYNAALDHYFMTANRAEITDLDTGIHPGWARTGRLLAAYPTATTGAQPVCRFYIPPTLGDSHFFSADALECAAVLLKTTTDPNYLGYVYETPAAFFVALPDRISGACPLHTAPVYRLWNGRVDSNHRYTTDLAVRSTMVAAGYISEGYGPQGVAMCAPERST